MRHIGIKKCSFVTQVFYPEIIEYLSVSIVTIML